MVVIFARPERTISIEFDIWAAVVPLVEVGVLPRRLICLPTELELFIVALVSVLTVEPKVLPVRRFLPLYCEVREVLELCR